MSEHKQRGGVAGAIKGIFPGVDNCSSPEVQGQCREERCYHRKRASQESEACQKCLIP
jgi:hypothetical protein